MSLEYSIGKRGIGIPFLQWFETIKKRKRRTKTSKIDVIEKAPIVLKLRYTENKSTKDIAKRVGFTEATVRRILREHKRVALG